MPFQHRLAHPWVGRRVDRRVSCVGWVGRVSGLGAGGGPGGAPSRARHTRMVPSPDPEATLRMGWGYPDATRIQQRGTGKGGTESLLTCGASVERRTAIRESALRAAQARLPAPKECIRCRVRLQASSAGNTGRFSCCQMPELEQSVIAEEENQRRLCRRATSGQKRSERNARTSHKGGRERRACGMNGEGNQGTHSAL